MKLKNTLFLLVFAGALFAFIKLYESRQLSTREAQERAGKVVTFDRDKIDAITIKNPETKIELRKDAKGNWRLEEPVKDRAESMAISQLFTTAESLRYDDMIGDEKKGADKDQLKEYGLFNSETKARFSGKEKTVELVFGKDAAVEGKVYVKLEGANAAYVIGKDLKEQISKKTDEFRDRKLTDLSASQVNKLVIKTSAGEIDLEKKDQHWSLTKPLKARGDDSKIGDLISQAATARIDTFIPDAANLSTYGLQEPRATVSLFAEGAEKPTVLQIGTNPKDEKDKEKTYASVSTRDAVVLLPKSIETVIETKPNDVRDKNLVRVEADIVDRITIEGGGKANIVLARSGESWVRKEGDKDVPINVTAAKRVLDDVRSQQVVSFVADVATDLPKYGLDQPQVKLTLSSYASENTAETKAGEKPIVTVHFGKVEGGNVYAKLEDEPFIVSVPQALLEILMTDPLQWQPLEIYKYQPQDITAIEVTREGQPPLSLERDKDKSWKLAKGDGTVNQVNVQSLVNTLARLRAVRSIGATTPEHGLDTPTLVVAFKAGNTSGKLSVGATSSEEVSYAGAEGLNGTFALSRPDVTAIQLPLIEKPASVPAAAAPVAAPAVAPAASRPDSPAPAPVPPPP
ncbi:MAG: hypothetical protein QOE70_5125 [Chthoniobacter sp.]|jgi:hypothetical protein|nr:hypothetical protein [Chthoniobacter sp.]